MFLDLAYFVVATCIAFKMAWILRQTAEVHGRSLHLMRFAGAAAAILIMGKAIGRFWGGDAASILDVSREAFWCLFLAYAIAWFHRRLGKL